MRAARLAGFLGLTAASSAAAQPVVLATDVPGPDGRYTLTKTGGQGPVGIGLALNGKTASNGTNSVARPAFAMLF